VQRYGARHEPFAELCSVDQRFWWLTGALETGEQMDLGLVTSLLITMLAVVSVFVEIPVVSDYAFWVLLGSYILVIGVGVENAQKAKKK
jgi:hypothetical protein